MSMFCYQCQEASKGVGCEIQGVCGKTATTAALQDVLVHVARGVAVFANAARTQGDLPAATAEWLRVALFTTITNANFDDSAIFARIQEGVQRHVEGLEFGGVVQVGGQPLEAVGQQFAQGAHILVPGALDADCRGKGYGLVYGSHGEDGGIGLG